MDRLDLLFDILVIVVFVISGGITAFRLRKRIRKTLGIQATDEQLTSIQTWMKVDEVERPNEASKPLIPK